MSAVMWPCRCGGFHSHCRIKSLFYHCTSITAWNYALNIHPSYFNKWMFENFTPTWYSWGSILIPTNVTESHNTTSTNEFDSSLFSMYQMTLLHKGLAFILYHFYPKLKQPSYLSFIIKEKAMLSERILSERRNKCLWLKLFFLHMEILICFFVDNFYC